MEILVDRDRIVNKDLINQVICSICHCIVVDATSLITGGGGDNNNRCSITCEHVFCRSCMIHHVFHSNNYIVRCPLCKAAGENIINVPVVDRLITSTVVKCRHGKCDGLYKYGESNEHSFVCKFAMIRCTNIMLSEQCPCHMLRKDLTDHLKICEHTDEFVCECDKKIPRRELDMHKKSSCQKITNYCPRCSLGVPKHKFISHLIYCLNDVFKMIEGVPDECNYMCVFCSTPVTENMKRNHVDFLCPTIPDFAVSTDYKSYFILKTDEVDKNKKIRRKSHDTVS